jgi:membrane-associated PAP2 superfamily phosphatase
MCPNHVMTTHLPQPTETPHGFGQSNAIGHPPGLPASRGVWIAALSIAALLALITLVSLTGPSVDLYVAGLFYDPASHRFPLGNNALVTILRDHGRVAVVTCLGMIALTLLGSKFPRVPTVHPRIAAWLTFVLVAGPGLLVNGLLKAYAGRPRPVEVIDFGGALPFVDWWSWHGACPSNCSFASGEAATAAWMLGPAMLAPPRWRGLAIAAATAFMVLMSTLRVIAGGHFVTDVLSGMLITLLLLLLVSRWIGQPTAMTGHTQETCAGRTASDRGLPAWAATDRTTARLSAASTGWKAAVSNPSLALVVAALGALTAARVAGLAFSQVDLFADEAQYWAWSHELAFGYFYKPPLLAWIIAAFEPICGTDEACVRAASPVIYFATSLVIYGIANALYGRRIAAWSAMVFALGTGVSFSARIISTDVPLLFFWAVALLAFIRLIPAPDWRWALVLGVSLGFGTLAKYSMLYFILCAGCAALLDRNSRMVLARPQTWMAAGIAALLIAPNVAWNMSHDFITLRHTGDNVVGNGFKIQPVEAITFIVSQFAVAGPLVFGGLLYILLRMARTNIGRADRLMLAFAIPPLALITALSIFRGANANWAAPAAVSMTVVVVDWWFREDWRHPLRATVAIGLIVQMVLLTGDAVVYRVTTPVLDRLTYLYHRTLGWRELGQRVAELSRAHGTRTIAVEGRSEAAELIYYLRNEPVQTLSWPDDDTPDHHFELTRAFDNSATDPVIFISACDSVSRLQHFYREVVSLPAIEVRAGPHSSRRYFVFKLDDRIRRIEPVSPCTGAPSTSNNL